MTVVFTCTHNMAGIVITCVSVCVCLPVHKITYECVDVDKGQGMTL